MTNPNPSAPGSTPARNEGSTAASEKAPDEFTAHLRATEQPGLAVAPARGNAALVWGVVGVTVLALVALVVIVLLIAGLGAGAFAIAGVMALVPLTIVLVGTRLIDRWEPEPRLAMVFAFLWGSAAAVVIALVVDSHVSDWVNSSAGPGSDAYDLVGSVIQAPLVEESAKGLGVLLVFLLARRYFDGPVDGIVYAAWVAGGFAFTENILYFGEALPGVGSDDSGVLQLFLIRGIMSPFEHVMFTTCTGLAIGLAARRGFGALGGIGFALIGLIPAMLLHALWNGALYVVTDFFLYYLIVQVPLFIGAIVIVVQLRGREAKLTFDRLGEYAAAGWFRDDELPALATVSGRRQAMSWARSNGKAPEMRRFIRDATKLAFARQRIISGKGRAVAVDDERQLLASIVQSRTELIGVPL